MKRLLFALMIMPFAFVGCGGEEEPELGEALEEAGEAASDAADEAAEALE